MKQAMEADRHAEADEHVHHGEDGEVEAGDGPAPQQPERNEEAEERQHHGHDGDPPLESGCAKIVHGYTLTGDVRGRCVEWAQPRNR